MMNNLANAVLRLTILLATAIASRGADASEEGWSPASGSAGLTIYNRPRKDSSMKEFKAIGVIEAEPIVVRRVLEDTAEFPRFMPYVTEAKVNEGRWLLEPAGPRQTRATYCIFCDAGGSIPAMVLNSANKTAIPKLFDAIRKQAKLEKYSRSE